MISVAGIISRESKSLPGETTMLRREIDESNLFPKSMEDRTTRKQCENSIALQGSLNDTEKSLDQVTLSLDRSESLVKRLTQQIRDLQDTENVLQKAAEFQHPEPANSEVSGRTFNGVVNRSHVCEANSVGRDDASSSSRDVFHRCRLPKAHRKPLCFIESSQSSCSLASSSKPPKSRRNSSLDQQS